MAKKLSIKQVKNTAKEFDKVERITFDENGEEFFVDIRPLFAPQKINGLVDRLGNNLREYERLGIKFDDKLLPQLVLYECVKSFTNMSTPKNIKDDMSFFAQFIETHYFKEIVDTFLQSEVDKVWDKVMEVMMAYDKLQRMTEKEKNKLANYKFKNPEVQEMVLGKEKQIPEA